MLYHPHLLAGDLTKRLAVEFLAKVRNPESIMTTFQPEEPDDEGPVVTNVPTRIASRQTSSKGGSTQVKDAEEDLNSALDEALENYDLATSWMESDGDKEVVRKGHQGTPLSRVENSRTTPSHPYHDQSTLRISDSRGSSHHSESPHSTPNLSRRRSSGSEGSELTSAALNHLNISQGSPRAR